MSLRGKSRFHPNLFHYYFTPTKTFSSYFIYNGGAFGIICFFLSLYLYYSTYSVVCQEAFSRFLFVGKVESKRGAR
jgi:hypothetical protein